MKDRRALTNFEKIENQSNGVCPLKRILSLSIAFLFITICFSTLSTVAFAAQSIKVVITNHEGESIDEFKYDKEAALNRWTQEIDVRSNPDEAFEAEITVADILAQNPLAPHTYVKETPRIMVEILQNNQLIDWGYLDERDTYNIINPGYYVVRCSTTIQVDGYEYTERTSTPYQGTPPAPTYNEGYDDKGRYEFYEVELIEDAGFYAYRYSKRYTYHVINSTMTYVSEGEADRAFVVLLNDPDALGQFASNSENVIWQAPTAYEIMSNIAIKTAIGESMEAFFKRAPIAGGSLLGAEVANIIYIGATPEEDLNIQEILTTGLSWAITKAICIKYAIGGPKAVLIGLIVETTLSQAWNIYLYNKLYSNAKISHFDDLTLTDSLTSEGYNIYISNYGNELNNFRFANHFEGSIAPNSEFNFLSVFPSFFTQTFYSVPVSWYERECYGMINGFTSYPIVVFDAYLLGKYKTLDNVSVCIHEIERDANVIIPLSIISHSYTPEVTSNINLYFNKDMDPLSFTNSSIVISGSLSGVHHNTFNYNQSLYELEINPIDNFSFGEIVTVNVGTSIKAVDGTRLINPYDFSYSTYFPVDLSDGGFSKVGNAYNFNVTYTNPANLPPSYLRLVLTPGGSYDMTPVFPGDTDYTDGNNVYQLGATLDPGTYSYHFEASDGSTTGRNPASGEYSLTVGSSANDLQVWADPASVDVFQPTTVYALVLTINGNPVEGETVDFSTYHPGYFSDNNGSGYTDSITGADGIATITYTPTSSGQATIYAELDNGRLEGTIISVNPGATEFIFMKYPPSSPGGNWQVEVTLRDKNTGSPLQNKPVTFELSPSSLGTISAADPQTDSGGHASCQISPQGDGQTTLTVTYNATGEQGSTNIYMQVTFPPNFTAFKSLGVTGDDVDWSNTGELVAFIMGNDLTLVQNALENNSVWQKKTMSANGSAEGVVFSPQGDKIFFVARGGPEEHAVLQHNYPSGPLSIIWSQRPDGQISEQGCVDWGGSYVGACMQSSNYNDALFYWYASSGNEHSRGQTDDDSQPRGMAINPTNPNTAVVCDQDGKVYVKNNNSMSVIYTMADGCRSAAWSPSGQYFAVGNDQGNVEIFNSSYNHVITVGIGSGRVTGLDFSADNQWLAATGPTTSVIQVGTWNVYRSGPGNFSIAWDPTSKYLVTNGGQVFAPFDTVGPVIDNLQPPNGTVVTSSSITISGDITDPIGISSATITINNGSPETLSLDENGYFEHVVALAEGSNEIVIDATDGGGSSSSATINITRAVDNIGPIISDVAVNPLTGDIGSLFTISARVTDADSGVNGSTVACMIQQPDENTIAFFTMYDDGTHGDMSAGDSIYTTQWDSLPATEAVHYIDFYAEDNATNARELENGTNIDIFDLPIIVYQDISPSNPTNLDTVTISAEITDTLGIASVTGWYSIEGGTSWTPLDTTANGNIYSAQVPPQDHSPIHYRFSASDTLGHVKTGEIQSYPIIFICTDNDGDGYNVEGGDCGPVDCRDNASSCTTDCITDGDGDGAMDCLDLCTDADYDEYGSDESMTIVGAGTIPVGSCTNDGVTPCMFGDDVCLDTDCDDSDQAINPGANEGPFNDPTCNDTEDNDCDGVTDTDDSDCQDILKLPETLKSQGDTYHSGYCPNENYVVIFGGRYGDVDVDTDKIYIIDLNIPYVSLSSEMLPAAHVIDGVAYYPPNNNLYLMNETADDIWRWSCAEKKIYTTALDLADLPNMANNANGWDYDASTGRIYSTGSYNSTASYYYDPSNNTVTNYGNHPVAGHRSRTQCLGNGTCYTFGRQRSGPHYEIYRLDTNTQGFTYIQNGPTAGAERSGYFLSVNTIYYWGSWSDDRGLYKFDVTTESFDTLTPLAPNSMQEGTKIGNRFLMYGGGRSSFSDSIWIWDPLTDENAEPILATYGSFGDPDGDGILNDGDGNGIVGDTPCSGGNTTNCDDNCYQTVNPNQEDTDSDGYGNACDADLDNDGFVGPNDSTLFGQAWWSSPGDPNWNPNADFDSDGFVGPNDSTILGGRWWTSEPWD